MADFSTNGRKILWHKSGVTLDFMLDDGTTL
jgi:hypothetical protein